MISGVSSSASSGPTVALIPKPHRGFRPRRRGAQRASTSRTPRSHRAFRRPTYDLTSNAPVGQNRRVGRKVNGTLVQGWLYQDQLRPVAQLDGSGTNVIARFVYSSKTNVPDYMVTSGGTYRILSDHLGSPRAVVDVSSGNLIETINFDEFGNETDTLAGTLPTGYVRIPFGFAGGLYDPDTTLVRFGARDYDASVGRWTAKDPVRFGGGRNLYVYAGNDPIDNFDVLGTDPLDFTPVPDNPFLPNPKCVQDCILAAYDTTKGFLAGLGLANRFVCGGGQVFGGPPFGVGGLVGMGVTGLLTLNLCSAECAALNAPSSPPPLPCDPTVQSCL
jgi:RHS repeat-associated protein